MWAASFPSWSAVIRAVGVAVGRVWLHFRTPPAEPPTAPPHRGSARPATTPARATLARLPVKGWDRDTDFSRYRFGEAWSDDVNVEFGHNGCNTRDDILRRDLADLVVRPGTCYAQSGVAARPVHRRSDRLRPRARRPPTRCRSTTWCRCPTLGTRVRASGTISAAATSPTTRATCWPSAQRPTSTRLFAMPPHGCRPTRRSAASSSHARSR